MRPANLLPSDLAGSRRALPKSALGAMAAGTAVGVLVAGVFVIQHGKVSDREQQLAALQAELAAVPVPVTKPRTTDVAPELKAEEDARAAALDQALAQRVSWDGVLRELSLVLPEDVWLSTLSAKSNAGADPAAAVAAGQGIVLNGFTYTQEGVARLLTRLEVVPQLTNVVLQSSTSSEGEGRRIVSFTISADVQMSGGATQ